MFIKICKVSLLFAACLCLLFLGSCTAIEKQIYPLEYNELIDKYSAEYDIPVELLAAVIYTESGFEAEAVSSAGAVGLMQIMPSTGEEIARRMGVEFSEDCLTDPETNISFGTYYMAYLYKNLGKNWDTACAAYNAGIGNVKGWLSDGEYSDDGVTLKKIPIEETSNYVEKLNKYKTKYKKLYYSEGE